MTSTIPFTIPTRVYWEDTDAGGVVYHASYVRFFERARTEWLRAQGVRQGEFKQRTGLAFLVRDMTIEFLKPALLDDELAVSVSVQERRPASILFDQTIRRADGTLLVRALVRVACVDVTRMVPVRIPDDAIPDLATPDNLS